MRLSWEGATSVQQRPSSLRNLPEPPPLQLTGFLSWSCPRVKGSQSVCLSFSPSGKGCLVCGSTRNLSTLPIAQQPPWRWTDVGSERVSDLSEATQQEQIREQAQALSPAPGRTWAGSGFPQSAPWFPATFISHCGQFDPLPGGGLGDKLVLCLQSAHRRVWSHSPCAKGLKPRSTV